MKRFSILFVFSFIFQLLAVPVAWARDLSYGLDVLDYEGCRQLQGRRVGLVTNAAAVSAAGEPGYKVLLRNGVDLRFLMAPEHGFALDHEAGQRVANAGVGDSLRVYSLYGESKKPDVSLLKTIDVLVFDLQDAGVRCYTYISTMKLAMQSCREAVFLSWCLTGPTPSLRFLPAGSCSTPASNHLSAQRLFLSYTA